MERELFISEQTEDLTVNLTGNLNFMSNGPFHVTDANFDETLMANHVVLVDFWAGWCGPCRALAPTIEELANEYAGKALVAKLDVDNNPEKAESYQVLSIPTLIVFKDGSEVERLVGLSTKGKLDAVLKKYLE